MGKAVFSGPVLREFVGKAVSPVFREFVGKAVSTSLKGICRQGRFGPVLMEFVGKAISDQS